MLASNWRTPRRILGALAIVVTLTGTAAAEPSAAEKETARTLLLSGREEAEKWAEQGSALRLREGARDHARADDGPRSRQDARGARAPRRGSADVSRSLALSEASERSGRVRDARREAKKLADGITPRLASLTVSVPKDAKVKIDEGEISASSIGVPLKVNPGRHQIVGSLGADEKRTTVDLAEGESKSISSSSRRGRCSADGRQGQDKDKEKKGARRSDTLVFVGGGIAGVGLVVGTITGLMAIGIKNDVTSRCDADFEMPRGSPNLWSDIDRGVLMGNIATGGFIVAGIGAGILVYGILDPQRAEPTAGKIRILPTPFGVAGTFLTRLPSADADRGGRCVRQYGWADREGTNSARRGGDRGRPHIHEPRSSLRGRALRRVRGARASRRDRRLPRTPRQRRALGRREALHPVRYSTDFSPLEKGLNRNFDLRRELHERVSGNATALTSIYCGAFAEILGYGTPLLDRAKKTVGYFEDPEWTLDFSTMDDAAAFTAAAAMDSETPRALHCASFQVTPKELAEVATQVFDAPFELESSARSPSSKKRTPRCGASNPEGEKEIFPPWQRMQYTYCMFATHHTALENDRYPDLKWTSAKDFLKRLAG